MKKNAQSLKSFRRSELQTKGVQDSLNELDSNVKELDGNIQTLNDKLASNDSRKDSNVVDLDTARNKDKSSDSDSSKELKLVNEKLNTINSSMQSFYKNLDDKVANDENIADIKPANDIVSSKLQEEQKATDEPKIVTLLSNIYDEIRKKPEDSILPNENKKAEVSEVEQPKEDDSLGDKLREDICCEDKREKRDDEVDKATTIRDEKKNKISENASKIASKGFRALGGVLETVSKFLYQISLAGALRFAKIAAIMAAVFIAIDIVQLQLRKWFGSFTEMWENLKTSLSEGWENLKTGFTEGWENLKTGVSDKLTEIKEGFKEGWQNLRDGFVEGWESLKTGFMDMYEGIKKAISDSIDYLTDKLYAMFDMIVHPIKNLGAEISFQMSKIVAKLMGAIPGMGDKAEESKKDAINQYIKSGNVASDEDMDFLAEKKLKDLKADKKNPDSDYQYIKDKSEEEQLAIVKKALTIDAKLTKIDYDLENRHISADRQKEIDEELVGIGSDQMNDEGMRNLKSTNLVLWKKKMEAQDKNENIRKKEEVIPDKSEEKEVTEAVVTKDTTEAVNNQVNNTQVVNQVNNSKTITQKPVNTSTSAPGMYGHLSF